MLKIEAQKYKEQVCYHRHSIMENNILIVDDSKTICHKLSRMISEELGLHPVVAHSKKEALEIIKNNKDIKLVFTDYHMPQMNGLDLTKELRYIYAKDELSIVAISDTTDKKIITQFLKYGANDFLNKDFSDEEFYVRLSSVLEVLELFEEIKDKANKDFLTGAYNRRYFFHEGNNLFQESNNVKSFMIDIDKFKNINDTYGHDIGDMAIKEVISIVNKRLEGVDSLLSRFGGEEFCGLIFGKNDEEVLNILYL